MHNGVVGNGLEPDLDVAAIVSDDAVYADAHLLRDVLALQPALASRWAADGTILWCNDAYAMSMGLTPAEMIGQSWIERRLQLGHDTRENLEALRAKLVAATADGLSTAVAPLRSDGPLRWFQWIHRRLPSIPGAPVMVQDVGVEVTELRTARDALDSMARELALGREAERRDLARRLHDDVVQPLVSASWAVSPMEGAATIDAADAERAAEMIRTAIDQLRRCLRDLSSPMQLTGSLADAIGQECAAARAAGITLAIRLDEVPNEEIRAITARVVNEALRNVIRHANATDVAVSIDVAGGLVVGAIADNGVGTGEDDLTRALALGHVGLLTSRSMVEAVGGEFTVRRISSAGGAMVRFTMPLRPQSLR